MKMQMYTMYDIVKQEMGGVMLYKNEAEAMRAAEKMFTQLNANTESLTSSDDFKVYKIGDLDTETMKGDMHKPKEMRVNVKREVKE